MRIIILLFFFSVINAYSITLQEIIETAKKYNPVLKEKEIEIKIQKAKFLKAKAEKFGEFGLYGSYNRYENPRILYPISPPLNPLNIVGAENQFIAGVSYTVPIFTGFQLKNNIKISKIGETLKKIQYRLTKNEIIYNIRTIYIKILSLEKQKKAFEEYKKSLDKLYLDVKEKVKVGKKAEVDLLKVEYDIKNVESNIRKIKNSILSLKAALKTLSGKDDIDLSHFEDISLSSSYPQKAELKKLDFYKQSSIKTVIAERKLKIAKGDFYPQIFFKASAQRNMGNSEYKDLWQLSINIHYNLFDFGRRKNQYIQRALELKQAKLQEKNILFILKQKLQEAKSQIDTAVGKIEATKKQLKLAKTVEDIEKTKYEEGISDIYDYLRAKAQRYIAESSYYQALYEREMAISYLKYILEEFKNE
jgi:outer membrane protein TolC